MEQLRHWFHTERRKLCGLSRRAQCEYVWQYYKLWIIGIGFTLFFAAYAVYHWYAVPAENWFYLTFANTYAPVGNNSELWRGYVAYTGYDTAVKNVYFNDNCYFDPADQRYNPYYTYFVAYVEAGTLDAIAMERDDLEALGRSGRLLDLSRPEVSAFAEKYADRLVYALPLDTAYSTAPVPIGIDLSDTCLVTDFRVYTESCALGLSANVTHLNAVEQFLEYVFTYPDGKEALS